MKAGHYLDPKPVALISYYAPGNTLSPFFSSRHLLGLLPIAHSQIKYFLDEPTSCGDAPKEICFDPANLKGNGGVDEKYEWPNENLFPEVLKGVDVPFSDWRWREGYPETVVVHGMEDRIIPVELGREIVGAIGVKASLFTVEGAEHGFDSLPRKVLLGNPKPEVVEKAWAELDDILTLKLVEEKLAV
ncbi:hypothetical protein HYFRA_00010746 [Hymenoscyphus fraxineus]|uniref:Peptidase S9 prolyl oligopeptidase catalytic domain-containing protein n=1 Tax=Hymenoscyphus fraxineus TaxID=746836 RepID=A0A9N9PW24_9HELO|nr:hypothetical protein HYFRA_00010746 [Hymenoscyphus fraxineus]